MPGPVRTLRARSVFINCPFDRGYKPLLDAILFTVHDCGFQARIALEDVGGRARMERIVELIAQSQYAICDLSRVDAPRLNMAFETGLVLGARYFGGETHRTKDLLILDRVERRYKKTLSDLGGVDGAAHGNRPPRAIGQVRHFLARKCGDRDIPGEAFIVRRFRRFQRALKGATRAPNAKFSARELDKLEYVPELINLMVQWQRLADATD